MDVAQIIISFNQFEETLDGFSMTFVERGNDDEIIQSFTCTHGNAVEGKDSTLKYIEPSPQTYIQQITIVQSEELTICKLTIDMSNLEYRETLNSYSIGGCGFKEIKDQWTLEFDRETFLLGFGGAPE